MRQGVRRPLKEPDELRCVSASTEDGGRRVTRPDVPPHSDREKKVTTSYKQQVTPAVRRGSM